LRDSLLLPRQAVKASVLLPSFGMYDSNNFALVPRSPTAVERAEPGAKRILSGMVADALALAKKNSSLDTRQRILLVDDDRDLLDMYQEILVSGLPWRPEVQTAISGARALAMLEAERFDLLICEFKMPKMNGLELLAIVRRKYPELRTVMLTCERDEQFQHLRLRACALGVDGFWSLPATEEESKVFLKRLQPLLERKSSRPLRIVMLDDEPTVLDNLKTVLEFELDDAKILTFTDDEEALQELTREDPDLFTTDWYHPKIPCGEMLRILASRQVKYPIFVISGYAESDMAKGLVRQFVAQGLNVTLLAKPWEPDQLRSLLLKHLGPGDGLRLRTGAP
jgi:CheY-like chemotaxis protein